MDFFIAMMLILLLSLMGLLGILYRNGRLMLHNKRALWFIGSQKGNKASFSACTGSIKRQLRARTDTIQTLMLDVALTKGDLCVALLDAAKQERICLTTQNPKATIRLEKGKRYTLVFRFQSATGEYFLRWE